jgi:CheY-like chemotaxis protein
MGKKILLADDSITIQKVIELTFSDEDFEVVTVGNGRLAIERMPDVQPDIVLCDIIMPEKDGYEVCEFVKTHPAFAHVPVLLLTGAFEPFDQERAARVGSNGHLAKPFEPQTLIAKVKELLSEAKRTPAAPAAVAPAPVAAPKPAVPAASLSAAGSAPAVAPAVPRQPAAPAVAAIPPAPAMATVPIEQEVTFIPEEPFGGGPGAAAAADAGASGGAGRAVVSDEFYGEVEEQAVEMQEIEPELSQESIYAAEPESASDEDTAVGTAGAGVQPARAPWAQSTVEVSWEDRAHVGNDAAEVFAETPVFDEVIEADAGSAHAPSAAAPRSPAEPESIPPMLLEYEPASVPPSPLRPAVHPPAPTPVPPRAAPQTSAADFLEEQAMTFEADDLAPRAAAPAAASARTPVPPPDEEVSFADIAAVMEPEPRDELSRGKGPSVAAEVPIPKEMVAQIAQRVVGQLSEKVIREVAWEILPDLAEAMIKKEIDRLTAELKEP